jgi:isochorismate synthase EntC
MKNLLIICILFLSSCSFYGVIGRNLDYILTDKLEDTFELNGDQEDELRDDIIKFLNNEKDFLKEVKVLIKDIRDELEKGETTKARWIELSQQVESIYLQSGQKFVPILAKYMSQLDQEQRAEVFAKWDKENDKLKRRIKNEKVSSHRRRFEKLFGDFTQEMKKDFKKHRELLFSRNKKRLDRRLRSQGKLKKIMNGSGKNADEIYAIIYASMQETFNKQDNEGYANLFVTMQKHITVPKRKKIIEKLNQVEGILKIAHTYKY